MKKFVDKTDSLKEPAIKTGNYVPKDGINLGWFSSKDINPKNNISLVDLSGLISENTNSNESFNQVMFANEVGVLEDFYGNPFVGTDEVVISDMFLDEPVVDKKYEFNELYNKNYVTNYYVSRYFTLLEGMSFIYSSHNQYIEEDGVPLSIKVVDENNELYADRDTGRKKYRITLEAFVTESNSNLNEIPHRITVYIEDAFPKNLKLIYDKVECDENGNWSKQVLGYSETINARPLFEEIAEESEVVDPYSFNKKVYSVKRNTKSSYINGTYTGSEDNLIYVNKKALDDNRSFEVFNWRLIAKLKNNVDFSDINYGYNFSENNILTKNINIGIIYSGEKNLQKINPYSILNLENSPFNLSKFSFQNPNATISDKAQADYWLLDIDNTSYEDLKKYDVLVCSLYWDITTAQAQKINNFLQSFGTFIIDCSQASPRSLEALGASTFAMSNEVFSSSGGSAPTSYNSNSVLTMASKNGCYDLNTTEFDLNYGIYGYAKTATNSYKTYKYFTNSEITSILSRGTNKLFVHVRSNQRTDKLAASNLIASTTNFLEYCNNIYASGSGISNSNSSSVALSPSAGLVYSQSSEGPFKFLYNSIVVGINDKIESTRSRQDIRSRVTYFTSPWKNNWVIDTDVLFEDELSSYYKYDVVDNTQRYVREVVDSPYISYSQLISNVNESVKNKFLDYNFDNVTLYIEYTNSDVQWTNTSAVTSEEKEEISSSYNVRKVNNNKVSCSVYTDKKTSSFFIPSGFGPHIIKKKAIPSTMSNISISPFVSVKNYPVNFKTVQAISTTRSSPKSLNAEVLISANVSFTQTLTYEEKLYEKPVYGIAKPKSVTGQTPYTIRSTSFGTYQELGDTTSIRNLTNVHELAAFSYTYDIDNGNTWDEYFKGKGYATYIRYIQLTLTIAGYKVTVDGSFGDATTAKLKLFQAAEGIKQDGIVDSQTKQRLAQVWKNLSVEETKSYISKVNSGTYGDKEIDKYIRGARDMVLAKDALQNGVPLKMINLSGVKKTHKVNNKDVINKVQLWVAFPFISGDHVGSIQKVTIVPENFSSKATSYNGVKILDWQIGSGPNFNPSNISGRRIDLSDKNANLDININSSSVKGNWISILIEGSPLGGSFGPNASGISISEINYTYITSGTIEYYDPPIVGYEYSGTRERTITKPIIGTVEATVPVTNISLNNDRTFTVDTNLLKTRGKLKSISVKEVVGDTISDNSILVNGLNQDLNSMQYKPRGSSSREVVQLSNINDSSITLKDSTIVSGSIKDYLRPEISYTSAYVTKSVDVKTITLSTDIVQYDQGQTNVVARNITGYNITNTSKNKITEGKNSFNYYDGIALICNSDGQPFGIDFSSISSGLDPEVDAYHSDIRVFNDLYNSDVPGLQYGFFDNAKKEFIGKQISFYEYQLRGRDNVYIAAQAYDYDGNLEKQVEFIGAQNGDIFEPIQVPVLTAYPVYKVVSKAKNKIQLMTIPENLSKLDPWPIHVSSGIFTKLTKIILDRPKGWVASYNYQDLLARYDTSNMQSTPFSRIFGNGYYDVINETPVINNDHSITARQGPIHSYKNYSNDLYRFAVPFKPALDVYIRDTIESSWTKVDYSSIKDVNCNTGVIEFKQGIVPEDPNLIKIDYTIQQKDILVKHSNGVAIPVNPFLNRDTLQLNKPLYIYLKPTEVYKMSTISNGDVNATIAEWVRIDDYSVDSVVNFTYDNSIFNKYDRPSYDPFAQLIGIIYVINTLDDDNFNFTDLRVKGGGISSNFDTNKVLNDIEQSMSYWDVYPPMGEAYPKGGYVIVKIPSAVKANFTNHEEVYTIVRDNITAGVVFELQDMDGNDWGSSVTISS